MMRMRRTVRYPLMILVVAVMTLAAGCSSLENNKLLMAAGFMKMSGPTDPVPPPMKEVQPVPAVKSPAENGKAPVAPVPPVDDRLLPKTPPPPEGEPLVALPAAALPGTRPAEIKPAENRSAPRVEPPRPVAASQPTLRYRNAILSEDLRWSGEVLIEGGVTVAPQATLTIEPGTTVRFGRSDDSEGTNSVLLVFGRIVAVGSQEQQILFTSQYAEPRASDWQGIVLMGSEKKNSIEQCRVEGAETGLDASFSSVSVKSTTFSSCATGASFLDSLVSVAGGGARKCGTGVAAADSEVDIRDGEFRGNRVGISVVRTSLSLSGSVLAGNETDALKAVSSKMKLQNNSVDENGAGLSLVDSDGTISSSRIRRNIDYGVSLLRSRMKVGSNEIARNGRAGIRVEDSRSALWNNVLLANGTYDLYNAGAEDVRAGGNWWGEGDAAEIEKRIFDRRRDQARGRVIIVPLLAANPLAVP